MPRVDGGQRPELGDPAAASDPRVLGQLLAAQNVLPVLPTSRHVADFYARALASIPGVRACRVCLEDCSSGAGEPSPAACEACELGRHAAADATAPARELTCALAGAPGVCVDVLATERRRFGFFVLHLGDDARFAPYRPFVANLGNFLALSLENREQRAGLVEARDALERRVAERTEALRAANGRLALEIEDRRRAEAAVRELNQALEQRVRERTAQLEAANAELEAFAYSASHDLRAPLRHVGGFLELLLERCGQNLDAQGHHYVGAARDAAARMERLIDDLLCFSRMGRFDLSRTRVELGPLARDVIAELRPEAGARAVEWVVGELPVVSGDRPMLRVVLVNLLSNALKFTRPRPLARIEVGRETSAEGEDAIHVRDNGVGFDPAQAAKLFRVFERLHGSGEFEGTGVGLATVRRIVQRHGGRTWAVGAVGEGATFCFALPRPEAP